MRKCEMYDAAINAARSLNQRCVLPDFFIEAQSFVCDQLPENAPFQDLRKAEVHTVLGIATIHVCAWTCSNGHLVPFDGSQDALFAASPQVVYSRVFLDAVLEVCVIGKSTMAAGCELLTSFMRNTGACADCQIGRARQLLSAAVGEFSDTLVIPACSLECKRCGADEYTVSDDAVEGGDGGGDDRRGQRSRGAFEAVIADSQTLSVAQEKSAPVLRPTVEAPAAIIPIDFFCAVSLAAVRREIRNRARARAVDDTALSSNEATAWCDFLAMAAQTPTPAPLPQPQSAPSSPSSSCSPSMPDSPAEDALPQVLGSCHSSGSTSILLRTRPSPQSTPSTHTRVQRSDGT